MIRPDLVPKYCDSPSYNPLYMGNFQALQPRAQVTFNSESLFQKTYYTLHSTISVIYVKEDALFLNKGFGTWKPVLWKM